MAPDLQLNIYSFYKLGTCRLWIQLSGDPKSGSAWRVPGWIPEDHAHRRMEHHMCFFWTSSPAAHVCAHVLWGLSFPKYLVQVHPAVLPQRKPSPRSMDFAGLTKQPPRKDFCRLSHARWMPVLFICLSALSAGFVWTTISGTLSWCCTQREKNPPTRCFQQHRNKQLVPGTAAVADHGHGHLGSFSWVRSVFVKGNRP